MRETGLLLAMAALLAVSCGSSTAKSGDGQTETVGAAIASVAEEKVAEVVHPEGATPRSAAHVEASGGESGAVEGTDQPAATEGEPSASQGSEQGGTKLLTKAEFLQSVWNYEKNPQEWVFLGNKPAIIDFYADWCGPCKIASPILEEVSHEFAGKIDVYKIDTQKEQELAAVFGVRSIPAFLYIPRNGKPTMIPGIARTKEDTKKMFVDNINQILLQGK
ncbi:MAG TPA: thioredoxin domain-containing protein [Prolixibacteraceae bacterium]|nr:thioredoxin domain-containing protein [Prolixibacteraceae bacterium]HRV88143.1 thioredoxin domain-containing protein [Prolixibacteraceae bacterium]